MKVLRYNLKSTNYGRFDSIVNIMVKRNKDLSRQERQDQERQENQRLVGHKYTSTIGIQYKSVAILLKNRY